MSQGVLGAGVKIGSHSSLPSLCDCDPLFSTLDIFLSTDYSPPGQFAVGGLYAPPAQVLTLSTTIATVEGFFSMARNGLTGLMGGFGKSGMFGWATPETADDSSKAVGDVSFVGTVQQMADLLTSGRLSQDAVTKIAGDAGGTDELTGNNVRLAQQLIATAPGKQKFMPRIVPPTGLKSFTLPVHSANLCLPTPVHPIICYLNLILELTLCPPEFHSTNLAERTGNDRTPTPILDRKEDGSYKAIVVILASGGMDSFNVLTPHTTCSLYQK